MRHTALPIAILLFFVACTEADNGDGNSQAQQQTENQTSDEIFPPPEGTPDGDGPAGGAAQPAWSAPPKNEVGVAVGFDPIVFLGDKAAVALTGITVYSTGIQMHATAFTHPDEASDELGPSSNPMGRGAAANADGDGLPDDLLRVAVSYPDGETAGTMDGGPSGDSSGEPDQRVLIRTASQGDQVIWNYQLWLWPRPEAGDGPLEFIAEWPDKGIELTRAELPLDDILSAVDSVVELWPEPGSNSAEGS